MYPVRCALASALVVAFGSSAGAQPISKSQRPKADRDERITAADVARAAAVAPNARLVAFIIGGATPRVIYQKGVQSVTSPAVGEVCVRPTPSSGVKPSNSVPIVSVEYYHSQYYAIFAQWARRGSSCPATTIPIYTATIDDAFWEFVDEIAFMVYVP